MVLQIHPNSDHIFLNFSGEFFGNLYKNDIKKFNIYYKIFIKQTAYLLNRIGVNINTVPVLDVRRKYSNQVIASRSFNSNHKIVSKIGNFCIKEYHKNTIGCVVKHIPGHGLSKVDSHKFTPLVKDKLSKLNQIDFFLLLQNLTRVVLSIEGCYRKTCGSWRPRVFNIEMSRHSESDPFNVADTYCIHVFTTMCRYI